jgi:hypothetical protein
MSQPWVVMPTAGAAHVPATVSRWKAKGYKLALFCDEGMHIDGADLIVSGTYRGVWNACNETARAALEHGAEVCLFAGDDMEPDPHHTAEEIAAQYLERFPDGSGLMQPCGDPQGDGAARRICGSAWFGREWIRGAYEGRGPTNGDYWHFFGDEELALVGEQLGLLWWRPDLTQFHRHWSWGHMPKQAYHTKNQHWWYRDRDLFEARRAAGFPGSGRR